MPRIRSGGCNSPAPSICSAMAKMAGSVASMRTIHGSAPTRRYFQWKCPRMLSGSLDKSPAGSGPTQVRGSSRFRDGGGSSHRQSRARAISPGSITPRLMRYPSRLNKRNSSDVSSTASLP